MSFSASFLFYCFLGSCTYIIFRWGKRGSATVPSLVGNRSLSSVVLLVVCGSVAIFLAVLSHFQYFFFFKVSFPGNCAFWNVYKWGGGGGADERTLDEGSSITCDEKGVRMWFALWDEKEKQGKRGARLKSTNKCGEGEVKEVASGSCLCQVPSRAPCLQAIGGTLPKCTSNRLSCNLAASSGS